MIHLTVKYVGGMLLFEKFSVKAVDRFSKYEGAAHLRTAPVQIVFLRKILLIFAFYYSSKRHNSLTACRNSGGRAERFQRGIAG